MRGSRGTPPPLSREIAEARASLAAVVATELPALEDAIAERDFDVALERATRVRGARTMIRGLLGGGDAVGLLRADWTKVEARIDAALVQSPRPNADRQSARTQWAARLARGTGSPGSPRPISPPQGASTSRPATRTSPPRPTAPRAPTPGPAEPPPSPSQTPIHPRGKRNSSRGRPRSTSQGMAAVAASIGIETYYPPSSTGARASPTTSRTRTSDFSDEPPTKRVPRKKPNP